MRTHHTAGATPASMEVASATAAVNSTSGEGIDPHGLYAQQSVRHEREQRVEAPPGQQETRPGGRERQQHALENQLGHKSPAPGAEGLTHGQLAAPRLSAHQQEVRDVCARDKQHERDGGEQRPQRRPDAPDHDVFQRADDGIARALPARRGPFILPRQRRPARWRLAGPLSGAKPGDQIHFALRGVAEWGNDRDRPCRPPDGNRSDRRRPAASRRRS